MKKMSSLLAAVAALLLCSCNCIGNGVAKSYNFSINSPTDIEIEGAWHAEIICGSDKDSCEIIIDENLSRSFSIKNGRELKISLDDAIAPMTAPTIRIKLKKPFSELSLEGKHHCTVKDFSSNSYVEADISDRAVCVFEGGRISDIEVDVSERGKLTFKNQIKSITADVEDRGVLEIAEVEKLFLDISDNGVCRVQKCTNASVSAEDAASVEFKEVKDITERVFDRANVKRPYTLPVK